MGDMIVAGLLESEGLQNPESRSEWVSANAGNGGDHCAPEGRKASSHAKSVKALFQQLSGALKKVLCRSWKWNDLMSTAGGPA